MTETARRKPPWGLLFRLVITAAALGWTFSKIELRELTDAAARIAPSAAVVALVLHFVNLGVGAVRWRVLMQAYGAVQIPPMRELFRLYVVGMFYNTFLPANVGGDVVRGYVTRDAFPGSPGAYLIVAIERVFGLSGLLLLGASVLLVRPAADYAWLPVVAVIGLVGAMAAAISPLFARRLAPRLPARLRTIAEVLPVARSPLILAVVLLLSVGTQSLVALTGHVLVAAIDPSIELATSLVFIPLSTIATYLPTVAGLGAREAAYVVLFGSAGMTSADATAASLAYFGVQLVVAVIGGLVHLASPLRAEA